MTERTELLLCRTVGCTSPFAYIPWTWPAAICGWANARLNRYGA